MKKLIKTLLPVALLISPAIAFAQFAGIGSLIAEAKILLVLLIPLVIGIALLVFFWGLVKFIFAQGSETVKADGKKIMIWGLIALFVMMSVWGIISFFQGAFLPGATFTAPTLPTFP